MSARIALGAITSSGPTQSDHHRPEAPPAGQRQTGGRQDRPESGARDQAGPSDQPPLPPVPAGTAYVQALLAGALTLEPRPSRSVPLRATSAWTPPHSDFRLTDKTI